MLNLFKYLIIFLFLTNYINAACVRPDVALSSGINELVTQSCDPTNEAHRAIILEQEVQSGETISSDAMNLKLAALNEAYKSLLPPSNDDIVEQNYFMYIAYPGGNFVTDNIITGVFGQKPTDLNREAISSDFSFRIQPDLVLTGSQIPNNGNTYILRGVYYREDTASGVLPSENRCFVRSRSTTSAQSNLYIGKDENNDGNIEELTESECKRVLAYALRIEPDDPNIILNTETSLDVNNRNGFFIYERP